MVNDSETANSEENEHTIYKYIPITFEHKSTIFLTPVHLHMSIELLSKIVNTAIYWSISA